MGWRGPILGVRFLLELGALAVLARLGWGLGVGLPTRVALGVALPVAAAVVWGAFVSPKARFQVAAPVRAAVEAAVFGTAVAGLALTDHPTLAWGFGVAALATGVMVRIPER